jgi:hypothetical protein
MDCKGKINPNCNRKKPNCVIIEYFHPTSRSQQVQEFYTGWDSKGGLHWKIEESQGLLWKHTKSIIIVWKLRIRSDSKECTIKIPTDQIKITHDSLAIYGSTKS